MALRLLSPWTVPLGLLGLSALACGVGPITDGSAPILAFESPEQGDTVSGTSVDVVVAAVDDDRIVSVKIFADGQLLTEDAVEPYQTIWLISALPDSTTHTLRAEAQDPGGNSATVQISVLVRRQPPSAPPM